ncbi:bifunctional diaminohydroxyphosphoribosylaminopyrimidine deaminase/5-amino-6-(5-phosphoribosylamino)uracil reductase RibD [uncultured Veillonella sp.]|uniref:bifunctional diaminohydroxyphosphoribosylaminopyrimidine deaminase/5-amino-6-(5-phosphoribosylamino)uracil reductase RibD n=1 Tax=uncultured Veillonella sp. TaxID=159268 RepID=UPI002607C02B|nr:bifunctional diaminohydroxyphosphoribosylaminopyrimidine deaminase/5-amino-6-(5-phosphoribosylamino)uracil reductase RibD [uncultured Veillonella sp.]
MTDEQYMARALSLAAKAIGHTHPNPMVGAVVVKDGRIIGEGYHHKAGEAHAEVNALREAGAEAQGATLYVTLEPCAHYGKTPPCAKRVIEAGLKRVVVSIVDPNPLVAGKGIAMLEEAGIEVTVGVLAKECTTLIEGFLTYIKTKEPFVTLKSAMSLDGKIATQSGQSQWITNESARRDGHVLRATHDAILVGIGTVIADNPTLNARITYEAVEAQLTQAVQAYALKKAQEPDAEFTALKVYERAATSKENESAATSKGDESAATWTDHEANGASKKQTIDCETQVHQPDVVILDSLGRTPTDAKLWSIGSRCVHIFVSSNCQAVDKARLEDAGAQVHVVELAEGGLAIDRVLQTLGHLGYTSVLVEGGSHVISAFMTQKRFHKIVTYIGNILIGGQKALSAMAGKGLDFLNEAPTLEYRDVQLIDNNIRIEAYYKERSGR